MASSRPFPFSAPAAPTTPAHGPSLAPTGTSNPVRAPKWPLLARIAEIGKPALHADEQAPRTDRTSYRVDAAHHGAAEHDATSEAADDDVPHFSQTHAAEPLAAPVWTTPAALHAHRAEPPIAPTTADTETVRRERMAQRTPLPIRATVRAWHSLQPHAELLRITAMLILMAAGGASIWMMNRTTTNPAVPAPHDATTAADHPSRAAAAIERDPRPAHVEHALAPTPPTDVHTAPAEPTAAGPLVPMAAPLIAIEPATTTAAPVESPTIVYPKTPYIQSAKPLVAEEKLPRAQFTEPSVAQAPDVAGQSQVR